MCRGALPCFGRVECFVLGGSIVKKLIARSIAMCLLAVPLSAFAQTGSDVSKDNMNQNTPKGPSTPRGKKSATTHTGTKQHSTTKDNMKPDTTKKSTTKKDTTKKDDSAPKQ
jgi:hypothetical protein